MTTRLDPSDTMPRNLATPPRFDDLPDLCTAEQARAFLQVGKNKIYQLLKTGDIESVHFGRLVRIPKVALLHGSNGQKGLPEERILANAMAAVPCTGRRALVPRRRP